MADIRRIDLLVERVCTRFATFGGNECTENNPIALALRDHPPIFALGVDVRQVVEYVVNEVARELPDAFEKAGMTVMQRKV